MKVKIFKINENLEIISGLNESGQSLVPLKLVYANNKILFFPLSSIMNMSAVTELNQNNILYSYSPSDEILKLYLEHISFILSNKNYDDLVNSIPLDKIQSTHVMH